MCVPSHLPILALYVFVSANVLYFLLTQQVNIRKLINTCFTKYLLTTYVVPGTVLFISFLPKKMQIRKYYF